MGAVIRVDYLGDASSVKRASRETSAAVDKVGRDAETSSGRVGKLGTSFKDAAKKYGPLAAAAAAGAVLKIGYDSLKAASDVEQAFGAVEAVFGKNSDTVKKWATEAARNLGLAKSEYANLAAVTGAMLKNNGIEDYAKQTDRLIRLGADLAAQYGGSTKDAVEAIGSLFRGEADPIEKYAVSIKQSDVNARLAADGLGKLDGEARKQAETQARLALLFEKSADAQGAFAREGGSLAQEQQKLGANWENLQATLGEKLLPVASKVTAWLSDTISGSNETSEKLRALGDTVQSFLTPIIDAGARAWDRINDAVNRAYGSSDGMRQLTRDLGTAAEKAAPVIGAVLGGAIDTLGWALSSAIGFVDGMIQGVKTLKKWAEDAYKPIKKLGEVAGDIGGKIGGAAGKVGGLFRSDSGVLPAGLGRASGGLAFGGGGFGGASFNVAAPQVVVMIDGRALAGSYYDVARVAARHEFTSYSVAGRRG